MSDKVDTVGMVDHWHPAHRPAVPYTADKAANLDMADNLRADLAVGPVSAVARSPSVDTAASAYLAEPAAEAAPASPVAAAVLPVAEVLPAESAEALIPVPELVLALE